MFRKEFIKRYDRIAILALALNEKAKREGILSLADEAEDMDDEFFKKGLRLVIDNVDHGFIEKLLSNIIAQEKDKNKRTLKTVQKEAVLCIQDGCNTRLLIEMMMSHITLSKKEEEQLRHLLEQQEEESDNNFQQKIDREVYTVYDTLEDFKAILNFDDAFIQRILQQADSVELAKALRHAGKEMQEAFFRNMSFRAAAMLKEDFKYMGDLTPEVTKEAQQAIVDIINRINEETDNDD